MTAPELDLAAVKATAEAASEGPWFTDLGGNGDGRIFVGNRADGRVYGLWDIVHASGDRLGDLKPEYRQRHIDNANHIATMDPTMTLALVDRLERAEAEVERLQFLLDQSRSLKAGLRWQVDKAWTALEAIADGDGPTFVREFARDALNGDSAPKDPS